MTTENETIEPVQPELDEVKNPAALLKKNRELLQQLTEAKAALQASQDALGEAQSEKSNLAERWYALAVQKPLEADLRSVSAVPWAYTKDTAMKLGLLKMQADAEGFERPVWFDEKGEPADLSQGLHHFLNEVYKRTQNDLGNCLRGTGASGGGAAGSSSSTAYTAPAPTPAPTPAPVMQLGLR